VYACLKPGPEFQTAYVVVAFSLKLQGDLKRFPSGMKALAYYVSTIYYTSVQLVYACLKPGPEFQTAYVVVAFSLNDLRREVIVLSFYLY
jgi:hypothetical protein